MSGEDSDFAPLTGDRVFIAFNPVAGSGERQGRVRSLVERLTNAGFRTEIVPNIDRLVEQSQQALADESLRGVIAAGGDGTASLVANRLPTGVPIATFPLGTENLLANYLRHTSEESACVQLLRSGATTWLDAGRANGRLFTLMAGCGFDADVVDRLHRSRRGNIRHWSYVWPILDSIMSYSYPALKVHLADPEGGEREVECRWAFVVNVPRYACGLCIAPDAKANDGLLNVVTFKEGNLLAGLRYLSGVFAGSHTEWSDVTCWQTNSLRIESSEPAPYQLDGDPGGMLPLEIHCEPAAIRAIVSPNWVETRHTIAIATADA
jgi:diacylglycerol kinase (ATP)